MEELNKFRKYLNEVDRYSPAAIAARPIPRAKFKIGDKVTFEGGSDVLTVTDMRKMFASDVIAYTVRFPDGKEGEYDETQLVMSMDEGMLNESAPGYDTRKSGEALPTLETVQAAYEAKQANLKEGTWAMGNPDDIKLFIRKIEELEEDYYEVVGNDEVFDGLGMAKRGAEFVLKMALQRK
jgi:hypothetical protein